MLAIATPWNDEPTILTASNRSPQEPVVKLALLIGDSLFKALFHCVIAVREGDAHAALGRSLVAAAVVLDK